MNGKITAVLCGLGFGSAFVPIWRDHPDVKTIGLYDSDQEKLRQAAEKYGITRLYGSFEEVLRDEDVDAVHLVTPIPAHEEMTVRVLRSGKHCACTVPMSVTLEGIREIVRAQRESGKNYMLMETTLYTRQYLSTRRR